MSKRRVWVLLISTEYEGESLVGVFGSLEGAKFGAAEHLAQYHLQGQYLRPWLADGDEWWGEIGRGQHYQISQEVVKE